MKKAKKVSMQPAADLLHITSTTENISNYLKVPAA